MSRYRIAQGKLIDAIDAIEHARLIETVLEQQSMWRSKEKWKVPSITIPASGRNEECPAIWNPKIHVVAEVYMGEELRVGLNSASVVLHLSDIHENYAEDYQWQRK